jgi:hypothetical protein
MAGLLAYAFGFAVVGEAISQRSQRLKPDFISARLRYA